MFLKKSVSVLSVLALGTIVFFGSCKKNDDMSSTSGTPETQNQVASTSSSSSFTITSNDGHLIGVNGVQPVVNPKTGQNEVMGCGAPSGLIVQAVSFTGGCALYNGWSSNGGYWVALYINGQQYKDPTTQYGLWLSSVNGLTASISGLSAGQVYNVFVRTYCNADTTGSSYYDSPVTNYTVPSTFSCGTTTPPPPTGGTTTGKKGRGK